MNSTNIFKPNLTRLLQHLKQVSRERNHETSPEALRKIQSYIQNELLSYGFTVDNVRFSWRGQTFSNLVARIKKGPSQPRFMVGAHFDSVPDSPGADDNASGIAALLEAARLYARGNIFEGAVEFIGFNLEEYGMVGSQAYAQKLRDESVKVAGMLSLEMVGYTSQEKNSQKMPLFLEPFYPDRGNFIGLVANSGSKDFLHKVEKIFQEVKNLPIETLVLPANGWIFPDARQSDHSPFWDRGFPALLITDTSFFRNPHYHTKHDTIETIDLDFLSKVTEATARTVTAFCS